MKKRLLLGIGLPLTIAPMILVACGSSSRDDEQKAVEYLIRRADEKGDHKIYNFSKVLEGLYGSTDLSRYQSTDLIFEAAEGQPVIDKSGTVVKKTNLYYKLGMAKAVYVTKNDGTNVVYNSDDHEKTGEVYLKNWQKLISDNENSINHPNFLNDLENARKIQFTLKDVTWVDVQGEKTEYKLKAEDYYAHLKHALQMNASYRYQTGSNGGGSKEADAAGKAKWTNLVDGSEKFTDSNGVMNNAYLFTLFETDLNKLQEKNSFIQKATDTDEDAITIEAIDQTKGAQMKSFFAKVILNSTYFAARPSDYMKANRKKNVAGVSGEVADYGYYWYGGEWMEMLFAGPYLPSELSGDKESWVKNKNYYDQEWVKSPKSVDRFVVEYKKQDSTTFWNNQWEAYKKGEVNSAAFSQLTESQKSDVLSNPEKYWLKYLNSPAIASTPNGTVLWNSVPARKNTREGGKTGIFDTREYNDLFSLMLWGKTIAETEADNAPMVSEHYYLGDGLRFRSLLSNAHNIWARSVGLSEYDRPWITPTPDGSDLGGSDNETDPNKRLIDNYDTLNTIFAFGENGQKIAEKTWRSDKEYYDKPEQQGNKNLAMRSSSYDTIKIEFKKLLDSFFKKHPTLVGQKIKFNAPFRFSNLRSTDISTLNGLAKVLNELDPRMEVGYTDKFEVSPWRRMLDKRASGRFFSWNNDYNGIGTWLDGLFTFSDRSSSEIGLLYQMAALTPESQYAKTLPELYKLAKELKDYLPFFPVGSPTFEQRKNANTEQIFAESAKFHKGTASNFDYVIVLSEFFYKYQRKTPNANLLKLVQEIQAVLGMNPSTISGSIINPTKPAPILKNNKFEDPQVPSTPNISFRFTTHNSGKN